MSTAMPVEISTSFNFYYKSAKPRCKRVSSSKVQILDVNMSALPVHFYSQKKEWMDKTIIIDFVFNHFVPKARRYL